MVREIAPAEFVARRERGEPLLLLDVREPWELEIASVPGIVHIPMAKVPDRLGELDRATEIVVLCRSGGRSLQVARFLESQGFGSVANLTGGILAWGRDVDPSLRAY
ncbi:MAG: rhodanese-like domain-containing protein [Steroidobacteraceae bacterium]|jgi:rhodanese-related sulfurtransferase|nr:rhodanese-like domain-containing protein [Steroidobacteraceae bacterium]